ncbi:MAG: alpha/beta fold hydrolase [Gammaproteobacteria bacterium]|jgi:pimeloyl-ACP methyl ester carboxylesterase|nr:alpha/beta fold hydrolase [Gammaproteobacteria bacterium]MBT3489597.1 alpha/beta fold hydrolase [Gammaproteobacteria bacterium]MBT3719081.1 alpha/beta fold hydrolase [Gammaproteobacteria bacterium]MBT3843966.1 alpha/beta fold hydrolase [Gammaproteobacteria bacterium]MBT3892132.1 alpha/beta fold hydrolase [Gammaproteobacteria bacterium]
MIDALKKRVNHSPMHRLLSPLLLTLLLSFNNIANAEIAILLHGLLGSSNSWERSGAADALQQSGWERAGYIRGGGPNGVLLAQPLRTNRGNRIFYLVDFPTLIPLEQQSDLLEKMITRISNNHPDEPIYLVGHSAGGIVARMVVVHNRIPAIKGLFTIASPHLGSPYADLAYDLATLPYPLRLLPKIVANKKYKALRRSRTMIKGLSLAKPGTLLHWLNLQPHPDIHYYSIIRRQPPSKVKDALVPYWSQDMNNIPAIRRRGTTLSTHASHTISYEDGILLGQLLNQLVVLP